MKQGAINANGRFDAVIFDCDGVMFDSKYANRAYYNAILRHFGKPDMNDEQFALGHMLTAQDTVRMLFPDPEELAAANEYRKRMTYFSFIKDMVMEPGLREVLAGLRRSMKTGVCTNRTDTMNRVLSDHALSDCFDVVVTARDVANPKPHPESLIKAARDLGVEVARAVYIGDSEVDAQAARAADMPFVAYQAPHLDADRYVAAHDEIPPLLDRWGDGNPV
ncbi:MAG: HAD family hydrolase [Desulfatibacillaceae bacterium]